MAPIHDTDIAEKRWKEAEWNHFELWEKLEVKIRRRKWVWIGFAVALFLILSAVPVFIERGTKWEVLKAARILAVEMNRLKAQAGADRVAYRLRFLDGAGLQYLIERGKHCSTDQWSFVKSGQLLESRDYIHLSTERALKLSLPGIVDQFCYDYLAGSDAVLRGEVLTGFGLISVKDLTEFRQDRVSIVLFSGQSAEISFE